MLLAGLAMVKNEGDIIESFVRHSLNYVDKLFVVLQPSIDGTDDILKALKGERLAIEIINNAFLDESLYLEMGSHRIGTTTETSTMTNIARLRGSFLAHMPVRSPAQLERKIRTGIRALDIRDSEDIHTGFHWRTIAKIVAEHGVDLELLQLIAADYQFRDKVFEDRRLPPLAEDSLPVNYSLSYDHLYRAPGA